MLVCFDLFIVNGKGNRKACLRMNNLLNEMRGEKFFLEVPILDRKQDVLDYLEENVKYGSDPSGIGSMDMCLDGSTYEEWLLELERREDIEYVNKINRCLSKTFFCNNDK